MRKCFSSKDVKCASSVRKTTAAYLRTLGMTNSEIAKILDVSYSTVWNYLGRQEPKQCGSCSGESCNTKKPKDKIVTIPRVLKSPKPTASEQLISDFTKSIVSEIEQFVKSLMEIEERKRA